jgi:aminopeptidase N
VWSPAPANFDDPADLFGDQSYTRGAMTLEALREKIGSHDFFLILRSWAKQHKYGNVTTAQFIRLSERVSGQDLDAFFKAWLYVPEEPPLNIP